VRLKFAEKGIIFVIQVKVTFSVIDLGKRVENLSISLGSIEKTIRYRLIKNANIGENS
jgi:hypothetical protein